MGEIQGVIINKKFGKKKAMGYIKKNFSYNKIDETKNNFRFRQTDPKKYKKFFIKNLNKNIKLVIGIK